MLVAVTPVAVFGVKLYHMAWNDAWREVDEKHRLLAESLAFPIRIYVENHRAVLDILSHHLSELAEIDDMEEADHWFQDQMEVFTGLLSLTWVDNDGRVVSHRDSQGSRAVAPMVFSTEETYMRARSSNSWAISGTRPSPVANRPVLLLAHPIRNAEGAAIGVLMAELNSGMIEALRHKISFGRNGFASVLDEQGHVVAHPNFSWVKGLHDLSGLPVVQDALAGNTGTGTFVSSEGDGETIVGYAPIPGLRWAVLVQQPRNEVEEQVRGLIFSQLTWAGIGLVLALVLGVTLARWITKPLKLFASASHDLLDNNFNGQLPQVPAHAPREVVELAGAIRASITGLQHSRSEIGRFNYTLQQRVEEATAQLREANSRLEVAVDEARQANEAKSHFLANMSHEIRTPMNGVLGMTELLLQSGLTDKQRMFAAKVQRSAESLLTIINDILDLSKIEAGKFKLQSHDFDLRDVVEEKIDLLAQSAHDAGLSLVCHVPAGIPTRVRGDATRLCQVLTNLVGNAIKFTERGEIAVLAESLDLTNNYAMYKFTVKDTGIGIPPEEQQKIFEAFAQAENAGPRSHRGTGLGLAITKQLVSLMGGDISVSSVPGRGTDFTFTVRFERQANIEPALRTVAPVWEDLKHMRVLVADKAAMQRAVLTEQLQSWGMRPTVVGTMAECVRELREATTAGDAYALLLLDPQLSEVLAGEMVQSIKQDTQIASLQVVLLTTPRAGGASDGADMECAAQIDKPIRQSQLFDCLANVVRDKRTGPVVPKMEQSNMGTAAHTNGPVAGRILLAEDNIVNTEVAKEMLANLGIDVVHVENGVGVLQALAVEQFDLVLMDCQMPDVDGLEATRRLRDQERSGAMFQRTAQRPHIPVIAVTANAMEGDREACLAAGMDDYMSKPFTQAALRAMLQRWLPSAAAPARAEPAARPPVKPAAAAAPETNAASKPVPAPPVAEARVLDRSTIDRLRALQKEAGSNVLERIINLYLRDSADALRKLQNEREHMAPSDLAQLAHRWKSSSANVGALQLADMLKKLEQAGRNGAVENAQILITDIVTEYARVDDALRGQIRNS